MNYNEFKKEVMEQFGGYFEKHFGGSATICAIDVSKNNENLEGLKIKLSGNLDMNGVEPIVYMRDLYKMFQEVDSIPTTLERFAALIAKEYDTAVEKGTIPQGSMLESLKNFDNEMKDRVIPKIVSYENNESYLEDKAYIVLEELNLALIASIQLDSASDVCASIPITNELLEIWGLSLVEYHEFLLSRIQNISYAPAWGDMDLSDIDKEDLEIFLPLTNSKCYYGAAVILRKDILAQLAEIAESDLFVIPSSVHEALVMIAETEKTESIKMIIKEINDAIVDPEDVLSNNLYLYSKATNSFSIL